MSSPFISIDWPTDVVSAIDTLRIILLKRSLNVETLHTQSEYNTHVNLYTVLLKSKFLCIVEFFLFHSLTLQLQVTVVRSSGFTLGPSHCCEVLRVHVRATVSCQRGRSTFSLKFEAYSARGKEWWPTMLVWTCSLNQSKYCCFMHSLGQKITVDYMFLNSVWGRGVLDKPRFWTPVKIWILSSR